MSIWGRTVAPIALLFVIGNAVTENALPAESELSSRVAHQDGWVGYRVPMVAGAGTPCCYDFHGKKTAQVACELEGRNWSTGMNDEPGMPKTDTLDVYLRVTHGQIDKVRAFGDSCALKDADRVHWLADVAAADSVALLARMAATTTAEEAVDAELTALALHADASATPALAQLADSSHPQQLREQALFWLGQARGAPGAQIVEHVATTDPDPEFRAKAVFDLSQSSGTDAYATILRIAQSDASDHVREQALFWMAHLQDARAQKDIIAAIEKDPSDKVCEQAVFALSQLKDEQADAALIALVRGAYPRKVKEQALFWLGESGSDKALKFLDEVLTRQPTQATKS